MAYSSNLMTTMETTQPPPYSLKDHSLSYDEKDAPVSINGRRTVFSKDFVPVFRDVWASILFILHLAGMSFMMFYLFSIVDLTKADPNSILSIILNEIRNINVLTLLAVIGVATLPCIFLNWFLFFCMKSFPSAFIKISIVSYLTVIVLFFLMTLLSGAIIPTILLGILLLINSLFFWKSRHRIPLTALVLKSTLHILEMYPSMIIVSVCQLVLEFLYALFSFFAFILIFAAAAQKKMEPGSLLLLFCFSSLSLFWTCQVLMNVLHVTVSGIFASFYLTGGKYSSPMLKCLNRSLTTSFGSICFGSLIVAVIQTIRFLVRSFKDDDSVVGAIADCILGCIENLASYFNYFAYTEVSIYGRSFISSAKDCWSLIKRSGAELIVNDILAGVVLTLGMLVVTVAGSIFGKVIVSFVLKSMTQSSPEIYIIVTAMIFLLSYALMAEMIRSGINTSIVCFCEEPRGVQSSVPLLYEKYSQVVSGFQV